MSKQSVINRLVKKFFTQKNLFNRRRSLLQMLKKIILLSDQQKLKQTIQKLSKNGVLNRLRNFCWHTGRTSGLSRIFGLSRLSIRSFGHNGMLPGLQKSSW